MKTKNYIKLCTMKISINCILIKCPDKMKIIFAVIGILCMGLMSVHANNPLRQSPYPQKDNIIYLNPAPLLVPLSMKSR